MQHQYRCQHHCRLQTRFGMKRDVVLRCCVLYMPRRKFIAVVFILHWFFNWGQRLLMPFWLSPEPSDYLHRHCVATGRFPSVALKTCSGSQPQPGQKASMIDYLGLVELRFAAKSELDDTGALLLILSVFVVYKL